MKTFKHFSEEEFIIEGNIFRSILSGLKSFSKKLAQLFRLPFGKEIVLPIHLPKNMMESQGKQIGKSGGELSEAVLTLSLLTALQKEKWACHPSAVEIESPGVQKPLDASRYYREQLQKYKVSESADKAKLGGRLKNWVAVGKAGATVVHDKLLAQVKGHTELYCPTIGVGGVGLTGYEKADVIIKLKKVNEQGFREQLKLSLKSTEGDPRYGGMDRGLQTSARGLIYSLGTDMSPTEAKTLLKKDYEKEVASVQEAKEKHLKQVTDTIQQLRDAHGEKLKKMEQIKNDLDTERVALDILRKDLPAGDEKKENKEKSAELHRKKQEFTKKIKIKKDQFYEVQKEYNEKDKSIRKKFNTDDVANSKLRYEQELIKIYKDNGIDCSQYDTHSEFMKELAYPGKDAEGKGFTKSKYFKEVTVGYLVDHMKNLRTVIENRYAREPEKMCTRILNLGGVEKGLDYIKMGFRDGKPSEGTLVSHTLNNKLYHDQVEHLFSKEIMNGMKVNIKEIRSGSLPNLRVALYSSVEEKEVIFFNVWVQGYGSGKMSMPAIKTPEGTEESFLHYFEMLSSSTT
jgi:hypothetical protein